MEELSQRLGAVAAVAPAAAAAAAPAAAADSDAHPDRMRATIERLTARLVRLETVIGCGTRMLCSSISTLVSSRLALFPSVFTIDISLSLTLYLDPIPLAQYIFSLFFISKSLAPTGADGGYDAFSASQRAQTHQLQLLSASVGTLVARHEQSRRFAARLFAFLARWAPAALVVALLAAQHRKRIVAWLEAIGK